ncbi:MAG: hypothetical protein WBC05_15870, partial [Sedimentisphaerales bacterium]
WGWSDGELISNIEQGIWNIEVFGNLLRGLWAIPKLRLRLPPGRAGWIVMPRRRVPPARRD